MKVKTEFTEADYVCLVTRALPKEKIEMSVNSQTNSLRTRALLTCGAVAGPVFTLAWVVESITRPNYNLLRHPVSSLALGDFGWTQVGNFLIAGLLMLAFAVGLRLMLRPQRGSTWGPLLIAIWGAGLLGAGIFVTDPVSGYPLGTPDITLNATTHGALHDGLSLLGFLALTMACFVWSAYFVARGERGWTIYSILTGFLFPLGIVLASAAFSQNQSLVAYGGLIQRITITVGWTWLSLLALHFLKVRSETKKQDVIAKQ
jgi:hypothetical protein